MIQNNNLKELRDKFDELTRQLKEPLPTETYQKLWDERAWIKSLMCDKNSNVGIPKSQKDDSYCKCSEELRRFIESEIWQDSKLSDNFGMTIEQSDKVNELLMKAHNEVLQTIINKYL